MRIERHIAKIDAPGGAADHGDAPRWRALSLGIAVLLGLPLSAQPGVTTLGVQVKPVIPLEFFDPLTTLSAPELQGSVELTGGMAFGMSIRLGLSNMISLETGIGQITRRYDFSIANDTSGYSDGDRVRYVGYEIPVTGLFYIRLGEYTWMNAAMGLSFDFYPSDAQRDVEYGRIYIFRNNWAQLGVLGNMGVEYRTPRSGIFYLGATYHRPFNDMATAELTYYTRDYFPYTMRGGLNGSYLTVDLRYYFHEDPDRVRRKP